MSYQNLSQKHMKIMQQRASTILLNTKPQFKLVNYEDTIHESKLIYIRLKSCRFNIWSKQMPSNLILKRRIMRNFF